MLSVCRRRRLRFATSGALVASLVVAPLAGCATNNSNTGAGDQTAQNDTPCRRVSEAALTGLGAALAGVAGALIFRNSKIGAGGGAAIGVVVGGIIGNIIGRDADERACTQLKIAQNAGTSIESDRVILHQLPGATMPPTSTVTAQPSNQSGASEKDVPIGQVTRWQNTAFASGSAELTSEARAYFTETAKLYLPKQPDPKELSTRQGKDREDYLATIQLRNAVPILLVGNTDDTGDSRRNQELSEARAKAVGDVFRAQGIDPHRIFYWGAGETRPIADNRTEEGRLRNRRVDIIEFQNQNALLVFLQNYQTKAEFYRPVEAGTTHATQPARTAIPPTQPSAPAPVQSSQGTESAQGPTSAPSSSTQAPKESAVAASSRSTKPEVDFGGGPVKTSMPSLYDMGGGPKPPVVSLAFISSVYAAAPPIASCTEDRARHGGVPKSLATGRPIESYSTADFLPGLNHVAWAGVVNDNLVAMSEMAVLRSESRPVDDSPVKIYPNWNAVPQKSRAKPRYTLTTAVNTYEARNGFLYRVFVTNSRAPVACIDLLIPYAGFKTADGRLHYMRGTEEWVAPYAPELVR